MPPVRSKRIFARAICPARVVMAALVMAVALAACGASAPSTGATTGDLPGPVCGNDTASTVAETVGTLATRIYGEEAAGGPDKQQVETYAPLLSALAAGNRAAVTTAVTHLVYSGTHIVRLRVTQGGAVLADVGGPYVLAPVHGVLVDHGRTVGDYVLSVQDDLGYVKLETRFIDLPLILMRDGTRIPLPGTITSATIPEHGDVSYEGGEYRVFSVKGEAFPEGALRMSVLVPAPSPSATHSCPAVRVLEMGHLVKRIWRRFKLIGASVASFVQSTPGLTGAEIYVRKGSHQLAGSDGSGPSHILDEGTVSYEGITYGVTSFPGLVDSRHVRVYVLLAA